MDQEVIAANDRLKEKRAALGVMELPIRSTSSVERCEHGVLRSLRCFSCEPAPEFVKEKCGDGCTCWECEKKRDDEAHVARGKARYQKTLEDLSPILHKAGVPAKYLDRSFGTFIGNNKAVDECRKYQTGGLVLYGPTGCGKTHLAVSVMRERKRNSIQALIDMEWNPDREYRSEKSLFITVPDLLLEIRSSFQEGAEKTEKDVINHYAAIPFLVLDDLGSEKTSEFAITTLYIIIDRRDRELLPTVITTNLAPQEIEERLSARISSRMAGWKNIKINMPDYRKRR